MSAPESGTPRIVVGVDGSDASVDALLEAQRLAAALGGTLDVHLVWEIQLVPGAFPPPDWDPERDAGQALTAALAAAFGERPPEGLRTTISRGQPSRILIEASRGARMLVLASRGLGGFTGLLLGSVSAACSAHAHCPVLIVPPPAREESSPGETAGEETTIGRKAP